LNRQLGHELETFELRAPFVISRGARSDTQVLVVRLEQDGTVGSGECVPSRYYGESPQSATAQIESARAALEAGSGRHQLLTLLPPGAARNALDAALWDLDARLIGEPVWRTCGLLGPPRVRTVRTISLNTEASMATEASSARAFGTLKLKLDGTDPVSRVRAVREAAPGCQLIADANASWPPERVEGWLRSLAELGVLMVEQPVAPQLDRVLLEIEHAVPLCADESCRSEADLERIAERYDLVNIKLDKCGGLTAALALRDAARARGLGIMVGCMLGSSLSMAPALVLAMGSQWVDLDGPYLMAKDRSPGLSLASDGTIGWSPALWGG
jgi:L-alanine-DL-glutamate epimerase-like enolase superfamily enzyme